MHMSISPFSVLYLATTFHTYSVAMAMQIKLSQDQQKTITTPPLIGRQQGILEHGIFRPWDARSKVKNLARENAISARIVQQAFFKTLMNPILSIKLEYFIAWNCFFFLHSYNRVIKAPKKSCIGITRPTLKIPPTLKFFFIIAKFL